MRELNKVIARILQFITETEKSFIESLKSKQSSVKYAAPEMQRFWWNETQNTMVDYLFNKDIYDSNIDWYEKVRKIWIAEEE